MSSEADRPDFQSAAYQDMIEDVETVRDVAKGTRHLRELNVKYLPQHKAETGSTYRTRLAHSVLFNGVEVTVGGMTGLVFRQDPVIGDDVPPVLAEHLENIDNAGEHFDVFSKEVFGDALEAGHSLILVDVPVVQQPEGRRLMQNEEKLLGVRPYWIHIKKEDVLSWRTEVILGQTVLAQIVIRETSIEEDGEFGEKEVTRYRKLWREDDGVIMGRVDEIVDDRVITGEAYTVTNQTEIPVSVVYSKKTGLLTSKPLLLDLAETNLAHYRLLSDHLWKMHLTNLPVGVLAGVSDGATVEVGPNTWLRLPKDATFTWETPDGTTFKDNRDQLQQFKQDMAAMGLAMLQVETRAAETAEAKRMDKSEKDSALATAARSLQDATDRARMFHMKFLKSDNIGTVTINRDFEELTMTSDEIAARSTMHIQGQISLPELWRQLGEGNVLSDGFDPELEEERLAGELTL